ncbi:MAG: hypothetical protein ACXVA9_12620 [Bdellovibrionales bacterium]
MIVRKSLVAAMLIAEPLFAQVNIPAKAFVPEQQDYDHGSYAAINFPVKHFAPALKAAEDVAGGNLITRGEAHLTVLTPPEFNRIEGKTRKKILSEMKEIAAREGEIKPLCLGRGQAELNGKVEFTYYIVIEAKGIRAIREKYHLTDFYPHITLGFTKRDLHFEDGVRKDKASCVSELALIP